MFVQVTRLLLRKCSKGKYLLLQRACSSNSSYTATYDVSPRCTINGFISYNTVLYPIDSNNTSEGDKLILKCDKHLSINQIGTSFNISSSRDPPDASTVCELHVPIKSNINISALGHIKLGDLQGDGIRVFSEMGSVTLGNLKSDQVSIGTNDHDIITEGTLEASRVELLCRKKGSIRAQKIKCLGLKMETHQGNITMNACYSKNGYLLTRAGNMDLKNVHNRCRIEALKKSNVNLVGLEGALEMALQNGKADLQIQKLFDDSDVLVREEGEITLRVPPELLDYVCIMVWSKGCYVDDEIPHKDDELSDLTTISKKDAKIEHTLRVRCPKGTCNVRLASWVDMMEKKFIESKQAN